MGVYTTYNVRVVSEKPKVLFLIYHLKNKRESLYFITLQEHFFNNWCIVLSILCGSFDNNISISETKCEQWST